MNENNLKPVQSTEEAREKGRAGGIKSGEVRREKKLIKDQLKLLLSLPLKDEKAKKQLQALGIDTENIDNQMAMVISMWNKAIKGDVQAFNSIRDTVGEKPVEKVEANVENKNADISAIKDIANQMKDVDDIDVST